MMIQESHLMNHEHFVQEKQNEVKTLFLLESPGKTELEKGYPCAGPSGKVMSKALLKTNSDPKIALGELIANGNSRVTQYALFDTFRFPLKASDVVGDRLSQQELIWQMLKDCERCSGSNCRLPDGKFLLNQHRKNITICIQRVRKCEEILFNEYKDSLKASLDLFKNLIKIIVCGYIAQCMFCVANNFKEWPLNCFVKWQNYRVAFIDHPINYWDAKKMIVSKNKYGKSWGESLDFG